MSLIPKKSLNLMELGAWRGLTLLTTDFKILSKTMALRLQKILPHLIAEEQNGFMKGRDISNNIRRTFEVIEYTKRHQVPGLIMTIDFYKCFDTIEHTAINGSLEYFGFPSSFRNWVKLFFTELIIYNQNYGELSKPFTKTRGINQGCCISPFIYLLCGEIMARKLKKNKHIQGINLKGNITALLSQFADDTTLFLKFDKLCLENVVNTLALIETHTGLCVNYDKTLIYRIGSLSKSEAKIYTNTALVWSNKPFTLLGIEIANMNCEQLNYKKTVEKMESTLENWAKRPLSLMGKALVINTLCESLFVYKMSVLCDIDRNTITRIHKCINKFLWNGKRARIARDTLSTAKKCGGIRLFSVLEKQKALKANWIIRALKDDFFKEILFDHINIPQTNWFLKTNIHPKDASKFFKKKDFWSEAFTHWCEITFVEPQSFQEIVNQTIWFNSHVKIKNSPIFFRNFADVGIVTVGDIYNPDQPDGLCTLGELNNKFEVSLNWLQYAQIKRALPRIWIAFLKGPREEVLKEVEVTGKLVNTFYRIQINSDRHLTKYAKRWEVDQLTIDIDLYKKCFSNLYVMANSTKLRDFQYRLLLNKIPCNVQLKAWKISESDLCTHRCGEPESIYHVLLECKYSKRIWNFIQKLTPNIKIEFSKETTILNNVHPNKNHIINSLFIIVKQYLYRQRCLQKLPSINGIIYELKLAYNIEKYNAKKSLKMEKCEQRWSPVLLDLLKVTQN